MSKILHCRIYAEVYYDSEIEVDDNLSLEEAVDYAKKHINEIPISTLEYIPDSDTIDDEDVLNGEFYFEENN